MANTAGGARPASARAIDCHAHVMRRDLPLASERHSAPKRDVSVEEFLGVLDAHGVSHGVLTACALRGMQTGLALLKESLDSGKPVDRPDALVSFEELHEIMALSDVEALEQRFLTSSQLEAKYGATVEGGKRRPVIAG